MDPSGPSCKWEEYEQTGEYITKIDEIIQVVIKWAVCLKILSISMNLNLWRPAYLPIWDGALKNP